MRSVLLPSILICCLVSFSVEHHEPDFANVHCGEPAAVAHGHFHHLTVPNKDSFLAAGKFSCDGPEYHLKDEKEAVYVCSETGKWKNAVLEHHLPVCEKVSCAVPTEIEHGHLEYVTTRGQNTYLSVVKYTCDNNYHEKEFSDEGVYACTIDGKWKNTDLGYKLPECEKVVCGKPVEEMHVTQRVIGGSHVVYGASPWSVLLENLEGEKSNGALIDHHWILTSAHALRSNHTHEEIVAGLKVYVGVEDIRDLPHAQHLHVEALIVHPRLPASVEFENDVALLKIKEEIAFGNHIMPVCLPEHTYAQEGKVGFLAGWGSGLTDIPPTHLRYAVLTETNATQCHEHFQAHHPLLFPTDFHHYFCTGPSPWEENVCRGDLGASFVIKDHGVFYTAGVLAYDKACKTGTYAVYTDIFDFLGWINDTVSAN